MKKHLLAAVVTSLLISGTGYANPTQHNIINNPGFEDKGLGWNYHFANIRSDGAYDGTYRGRIAVGTDHHISQDVIIPETAYYDLTAYVKSEKSGAKFGLKNLHDDVLIQKKIPSNKKYKQVKLKNIALEQGESLQVFFSGAKKSAVSIDNVELVKSKKNKEPKFNQIVSFGVEGQSGVSGVHRDKRTIEFSVPFGSETSKLAVSEMRISPDSYASIRAGDIIDFSEPVTAFVTDHRGNTERWKLTAIVENKEVTITSSNQALEQSFIWAIDKTKQFVMTGKNGLVNRDENNNDGTGRADYIPSYWAGYFDRTAFYSRDFLHQSAGAWLAGLAPENYSMFKTFARHSTEPRKWYTLWAINFDGTPHVIDYHHDEYFVREVPAQFEFIEKAYEQFLWTGDRRYIEDEELWHFYTKVLTDYIALHDDQDPNGIAEGYGGIFEGSATYNERGEFPIEAGDGIGSQYQATLSYAKMLQARGEHANAQEWQQKADDLKTFFNEDWSIKDPNKPLDNYVNIVQKDGLRLNDFGKENSWFMPMKLITEPGVRNNRYLDFISANLGEGIGSTPEAPNNIEAYTYIPETYFPYNQNEEAWKWMNYIINQKDLPHERPTQGTNGDYPEISFTFISNTIEGLMGVEPNAAGHQVTTASHLPHDVEWLEVEYLPMGEHELKIRHEGLSYSTVTNTSEHALTWEARFYGDHSQILIDGVAKQAQQKEVNGVVVSYVTHDIAPNGVAIAQLLLQ
ncbi:hypothetical protein C9I98_02445 [Photobacterium sanctipauli]|uniref:Alpha-L-rhamnosidase six-hairpin glycosidase domain-containing protein n=1 Tax=Photobacterium sanctipauli TaxID=1342794 RepID=A0A2T3P0U8_9GAMM|nr:hypothetical protein [Photobacterium sanctipauli]PSW22145.1 hypothetical protein C9I98_02445 [Photobacterium sanctipauli]